MEASIFRAPTDTPWGKPEFVEELEPGIYWVGTPSHGGVMVDRRHASRLSPQARKVGEDYRPGHPAARQWLFYEEDCDVRYAIYELPCVAKFFGKAA